MIEHYDRLGATTTLTVAGAYGDDPVMARLASGGFVLVWREEVEAPGQNPPYDIRVQLFGPDGAQAGPSFLAASTGLVEFEPAVTPLAGGGFAVAWRELGSGSSLLRIQAYDSAGTAVGAPISIAGANPRDPAISQLADGSLAVTWVSAEPTPDVNAVRVQRFDSSGAPVGGTASLANHNIGDWSDPQITGLGSGGYVVTWFYLKGAPTYQRTSAAQVFGADGTALGPAFDVSGATSGDQRNPQVTALAGGGFVIVWSDEPSQSVDGEIRGRIYADNGAPVGPEFTVSENSTGLQVVPRVAALASGGFAVSWSAWDQGRTLETDSINVRVFDSTGRAVGTQFRADTPSGAQGASSIVELGSGDLAVAWHSQGKLKLQLFVESAGDGVSDILLSTQIVKEQGVGGLAVATLEAPGGAVNAPTMFTLVGDSSGAFALVGDALVLTDPRRLDFETQPNVQLTLRAVDASGIAFEKVVTVQVQDQAELAGALVAGAELSGNTTTFGFQHSPMAAKLAGGGYVILWYNGGGSSGNITAQLFDAAGAKTGGELTIGTNAMRSSVAALGDGFVATWVTEAAGVATIHGRLHGANGAALGEPFIVAQTAPQGFWLEPKVEVLSGGGFVVAWSQAGGADSSLDTVFKRFDSSGAALGPLAVANASTTGAQTVSGVTALADGGFLLVWHEAGEGVAGAVRARRFAADGNAAGDSFLAPAEAGGAEGVAAGQPDGSFAIAWISGERGVMLQLFDPSGARVGAEVVVGEVGSFQWVGQPAIEALAGGGYIVSWARDLTAPLITNTDIVAQRIGVGGELVGDVIPVNSTLYRAQQSPAIAADGNGGFMIAWDDQSELDGGSLTEVKARVFTDVSPLALARNDSFQTDEATALGALSVFSNNGSGADGAPASGALLVVAVNGSATAVGKATILASGARLTLQSNGSFVYDPNGAFDSLYDPASGYPSAAVDRFTYTLAGGSTATVSVAIGGRGFVFTGGTGSDRLVGTPADDLLDGGAGADEMIGAQDDDIYVVDNPGDLVVEKAGEGNDEIRTGLASYSLANLAHVEALTGTSASGQRLTGNGQANRIAGAEGNDVLDGAAGADRMAGGPGNDSYNVDNAGDLVVELAGEGSDTVATRVNYTLGANVENLQSANIGGSDPLTLTGNGLNNYIWGTQGNNILNGAGGADFMVGYAGNDIYHVDHSGDIAYELDGGGLDTVATVISYTLAANVENLQAANIAGTAALALTGNGLNNYIWGTQGNNVLNGGGGADFMIGYAGNDIYHVDSGSDIAYELDGGGADTVVASISYTLAANVENLQALDIGGTAALSLTGNALRNFIWGTQGNNVLDGAGGADVMIGYGGDDIYFADNAGDVTVEEAGGGSDTVAATSDYALGANMENLQAANIGGTANLALTGNDQGNFIWGTQGSNLLAGRGGNDRIFGYGGADQFLFNTAAGSANADWLDDFQAGTDKILLDNAVFTALADGALPAGAFVTGTAAADADDRIIFNPADGSVHYDADGSGAGAALLIAYIPVGQALTAADLLVV